MTESPGSTATVHVLRVTLRDVRPAVWRRLEVPSAITLGQLHPVLQAAFDWRDDHLHDFEVRGVRYQQVDPDLFRPPLFGNPPGDEDITVLARVAPRPGDVLDYTYDFGDDWQHRLEVESAGPARPDVQYPVCTAGSGLAPEEDTGRVRRGQFSDQTQQRVNAELRRIGAVHGRDLPVTDVGVDPHFAGLFPDLSQDSTGECPCGCGETVTGSAQPALPMLRPAPEDELAALAAASPMVRRAVALATWIGPGRSLTPSHLLRPADAVRAVDDLGLAEVLLPRADRDDAAGSVDDADDEPRGSGRRPADTADHGSGQQVLDLFADADQPPVEPLVPSRGGDRRVRSAKDLPCLHPLWVGCLAAGLIEVRGPKAYPGPGLALWQGSAPPAAQIEAWCALLGGHLRAWDDAARARRDQASRVSRQVLKLGIPLLYALGDESVPVGAMSLAFADQDELENPFALPMLLRLPAMFAQLSRVIEDWLVAGVVEQVAFAAEDAQGLAARVAEVRAEVEKQFVTTAAGSAGSEHQAELEAALTAVVEAVTEGPAVRLTPLGGYGLARVLSAHGWRVPRVGDCVDADPGELLDRLAAYLPRDAEEEAARWVDARGTGWARALEQVMWSAAVASEEGPERRGVLPMVLRAPGPRVAPVLGAGAGDPWLAPVLAITRYQMGLGEEPTVAQLLWLTVDGLSVTLKDPDAFAEEVPDSPLAELLAQPSGLADLAGLNHPHGREVLQAASQLLGDPDLRREVRRALAGRSGNPALRVVARRPARSGSGRGQGSRGRRGGR